jgi:hypothetical protein
LPLAQMLLTLLAEDHALARIALRERAKASGDSHRVVADSVHLSVESANVTVDCRDKRFVSKPIDEKTAPQPRLTVERWSDLSIGIDESHAYTALTPATEFGAKIAGCNQVKLELPGDRWRVLLIALADSRDGQTVSVATIVEKLGYFQATSRIEADGRARPGAIQSATTSDLTEHASRALATLKSTLRDLRRELQKLIQGPSGKHKNCLQLHGDNIHAGFRVAYLVSDETRHLRFGLPRS